MKSYLAILITHLVAVLVCIAQASPKPEPGPCGGNGLRQGRCAVGDLHAGYSSMGGYQGYGYGYPAMGMGMGYGYPMMMGYPYALGL